MQLTVLTLRDGRKLAVNPEHVVAVIEVDNGTLLNYEGVQTLTMSNPLTEDDISIIRAGLYNLGGALVMSATKIDALVEKLRVGHQLKPTLLQQIDYLRAEKEVLLQGVHRLRTEINCRIEHGVCGSATPHLTYVQDRLDALLDPSRATQEMTDG